MTASLLTAPVQAFVFMLGFALIHAAREQAALLTRWLAGSAAIMAALTVIAAAVVWAPAPRNPLDGMTVHAAIAGQPPDAE